MNITDRDLLETRAYIAGEWHRNGAAFPVTDPATAEVIANVADCGPSEMAAAIAAAKAAQPGWAARLPAERAAVLRRWHDLMMAAQDDLAAILTAEQGKPLTEARGEIAYGASFFDWYAEEARRIYGETIPPHAPGLRLTAIRQPVGVVGAITPWNFPNAMIARKVAPALAVGCAVVLRPSELTPLSALALAKLADRAGLPKGLLNVVTGLDADGLGRALTDSPDIAKLTFTGSTRIGRLLMERCAPTVKRLSLELGGNAPFLVFNDADPEAAANGAMTAKFRNGGQTCVCANRLYVQSGIHDAFAKALAARIDALRIGPGTEEGVAIGPLINAAAVEKARAHLEDAVARGGTLVTGGETGPGTFMRPALIRDVPADALLTREETFGPVAGLVRFDSEADAIRMANDAETGLAAYLYTRDLARAARVSEALQTGMVGVNTGLISTAVAPFGGIKQSGLGREGGHQGAEEYLETKYICTSIS